MMTVTVMDIRDELRSRVLEVGTQRALAGQIGVSQQYLSDVLAQRRGPGPAILRYLRLRIVYESVD